jgi:diguanylate cyclase (GGDEF)-like protein
VRKRVAIAGCTSDGLALIPLLEANPEIDVCAIYSPELESARAELARLAPRRSADLQSILTDDARALLGTPGLVALVDAGLASSQRAILSEAPGRGIQVTTPLIARLLFAFGPIDGAHRADLLAALAETLDSYHLTIDRRALLERALQIAVASTGADRGSLMLWDPEHACLRVAVALGIEPEVIAKIRIRSGEGIAGRAWAEGRAISLSGRADHEQYRIARTRRDVAAALSVPLEHEGMRLGVLNLSHATDAAAFDAEDLEFTAQLARIEARIIARADEHHRLVSDSARLRAEGELRAIFGGSAPFTDRLAEAARLAAAELGGGLCQLFLQDRVRGELHLCGSSSRESGNARRALGPDGGLAGRALAEFDPLVLASGTSGSRAVLGLCALRSGTESLGLLTFEGTIGEVEASDLEARLRSLCQALGLALGDALRQQRQERETRRSALLAATAVQLGASGDATALLRLTASCARDLLEAEHVLVRLQDEQDRLRVRAYVGRATADEEPDLFELESGLSHECLRCAGVLCRAGLASLHAAPGHAATPLPDCALVVPIVSHGRARGTLSALGRCSATRPFAEAFDDEDRDAALQLVGHLQLALETQADRQRTLAHQRFDPLTGLPNGAQLEERIEAEIARSKGRGHRLYLLQLHVPSLKALCEARTPEAADELVTWLAHEVRGAARDFDVVARTGPDSFAVLVPEPELEPAALIAALTRRLRGALARELGTDAAAVLPLEFGYALFPDETSEPEGLLALAQRTRVLAD